MIKQPKQLMFLLLYIISVVNGMNDNDENTKNLKMNDNNDDTNNLKRRRSEEYDIMDDDINYLGQEDQIKLIKVVQIINQLSKKDHLYKNGEHFELGTEESLNNKKIRLGKEFIDLIPTISNTGWTRIIGEELSTNLGWYYDLSTTQGKKQFQARKGRLETYFSIIIGNHDKEQINKLIKQIMEFTENELLKQAPFANLQMFQQCFHPACMSNQTSEWTSEDKRLALAWQKGYEQSELEFDILIPISDESYPIISFYTMDNQFKQLEVNQKYRFVCSRYACHFEVNGEQICVRNNEFFLKSSSSFLNNADEFDQYIKKFVKKIEQNRKFDRNDCNSNQQNNDKKI